MHGFDFDLIRMREAVESKTISIPLEALDSFEKFDEWITTRHNLYTNIRNRLPNPFTTDYQYKNGPLDLYTETEMLKFAEAIINHCVYMLDVNDILLVDGVDNTPIPSTVIKKGFGMSFSEVTK